MNTRGVALSPDGGTVLARVTDANNAASQGATWSPINGWQLLPSVSGAVLTDLYAASQNGNVIVGRGLDANQKSTAFRWTTAEDSVALAMLAGDTKARQRTLHQMVGGLSVAPMMTRLISMMVRAFGIGQPEAFVA